MTKFLFFCSIILMSNLLMSQVNKIILDEPSGKQILVGYVTREAFSDTQFSWYDKNFEDYKVNTTILEGIEEEISGIEITAVIGSWCGDTKRELPRFHKILDYLNFPSENLKMIALDVDKKTDVEEFDKLKVSFVPTLIFYKNGEEIGRIVEQPYKSLEEDIVYILRKE
ncbi:MAG: thioredoxin family protein [Ignavibacteriaceae bacterium]|nr:thioredoxin family protein [Ignavibacteriaceae bacterium]